MATEWAVDATDKTKWTFKLRPGVKFHDGSAFNADAVVWNVEKVLKREAPHFDASQVGVTVSRMPTLRTARKIDDLTVELTTSEPDSFLPINLTNLFMASPAHWNVQARGRSSLRDRPGAARPAGLGGLRRRAVRHRPVPRRSSAAARAFRDGRQQELLDPKRTPKIDRVVLLPLADANARTAALLSNQVDWIEAPAPDALPRIRSGGFTVYSNPQPHVWPWQLSFVEGSPWLDKRTRHAANLCINREELKTLLGGLMGVPKGSVSPDHPWWGNPTFDIKYDAATAKRLMTEAGYSAQKPMKVKVLTSASGSGQMQPVTMNEYLQQALKECFFDVELDVIEWNAVFTNWREGAKDPKARGANAINVTFATMDPFFAMVRFVSSKTIRRSRTTGALHLAGIRRPHHQGADDVRWRGAGCGARRPPQADRRGGPLRLGGA